MLAESGHISLKDTTTLKGHLEQFKNLYGKYPEILTADAGYGSEENYNILENNKIEAYIKYNYFEKDQNKRNAKSPFSPKNMHFDNETDSYYCPEGHQMKRIGSKKSTTENGYEQN